MQKKFILPIGISGSGKSTYIKKHFKPEVVVNPDSIRKELTGNITNHDKDAYIWTRLVPARLKAAMDKYGEAVLDATNVLSSHRKRALKMFGSDVKKIAIVFNVDPEITKNRISKDLEMGIDRSVVPPSEVDRQYTMFMNGIKTIERQFDEVIYVNQDVSEQFNVGQRVWIRLEDKAGIYDSGKVLSYDSNKNIYKVKAENKGNIFSISGDKIDAYDTNEDSMPIVRRNFMRESEIHKMIKNKLMEILDAEDEKQSNSVKKAKLIETLIKEEVDKAIKSLIKSGKNL